MTEVNSPAFLKKIVPRGEFSRSQLNLIDNLLRVIEQLYERSGGSDDLVGEQNVDTADLLARIAKFENELKDDPLTWDIDSLTWDIDFVSFDMDKT